MLELKPCPFCGGTDIDAAANSVDCMTCGASATQDPDIKPSDYPDPKDAVKAWNRRSPAPTVGDDLVEQDGWLLMKRGLYYRPNAQGYTGIREQAGIYSEAESKELADHADGVTMVRYEDAPEVTDACYLDYARDYYRDKYHEAATALTTLRERVARLEGLLRELEDTLTPAEQVPPKDPAYGDEVRAFGLRIGFGALMASASHEWRQWLADNGYPLGSEFVAGPCRAVLESDLRAARRTLRGE